jgi:hypothetical protein
MPKVWQPRASPVAERVLFSDDGQVLIAMRSEKSRTTGCLIARIEPRP